MGKGLVTMTVQPSTAYVCPGCGRAVEVWEDFVVAREHNTPGDFSLHSDVHDLPFGAERRFHVEHFRGRIGDYVYELIQEASR